MTSLRPHRPGRFQIRTLLLAVVVVATVTHVFLQPEPKARTMGGSLVIESFFQAPVVAGSDGTTNSPPQSVENGRWRLRTRSGRLLAEGAHRQGVPQGRWRYYDTAGQLVSSGECDDGLLVDRWMTWHRSGQKRCEAHFARGAKSPMLVASRRAASDNVSIPPIRLSSVRHGTVTWWDELGNVEQREEFRDGARSAPSKTASKKQLYAMSDGSPASATYRDRCMAIHRLQQQGAAGVPVLLSMLNDSSPPTQRRVLAALEAMGPIAADVVPSVTAIARATDHPLAIEAAFALMAIDPANRQHWLLTIVDATVNRDPTLVNDLSILIYRPQRMAADFEPLLSDSRPEVRRLAAAMLLYALEFTTYEAKADVESSWHAPDLGYGPIVWSPYWDREPRSNRIIFEIAERVVPLLERLEHDSDPMLQSAVAEGLEQIRSQKRLPGVLPGHYGGYIANGVGF